MIAWHPWDIVPERQGRRTAASTMSARGDSLSKRRTQDVLFVCSVDAAPDHLGQLLLTGRRSHGRSYDRHLSFDRELGLDEERQMHLI